jgi:hypothetical protein
VIGILDMRPGKHDLHFLEGVDLLPHAFVNIPDKKMHIGVLLYILFIYICSQFSTDGSMTVTVISISHLSSPSLIPNVKCIAWNFNGSNFVGMWDEDDDLKRLRFENGDTIPNVERYFVRNEFLSGYDFNYDDDNNNNE